MLVVLAVAGVIPVPLPTPEAMTPRGSLIITVGQFAFLAGLMVVLSGFLGRLRQAVTEFDEQLERTTSQLRASQSAQVATEARYTELVRSLPDAVLLIEPDGRIAQANQALEAILGLPAGAFEGKRLGEIGLFPPAERDRVYEALAQTMQGQTVDPITLAIRHASGEPRWIEASARLVSDSEGGQRILTLVRDTTERRRGEQSRRMLAQAIAGAHNAMTLANSEGVLTYVNAAFVRMWGYEHAADCEGRPATEFWADTRAAAQILARLRGGEPEVTGRLVAQRRDGSHFDVELAASVIEGETGSTVGFMGSFTDITARLAAERALTEREAQLRRAKHLAKLGGWELDLTTQTLTWDDEVKRIHEVPVDYVPDVASAIGFYTPESQPIISAAVERLISHAEPYLLELSLVSATGRPIWARVQGEAEIRDGRVVKVFGIFQDLTELHEATERLRAAEERLAETERLESLGRLAGGVAHDFNNLLTAILGYADEVAHELPAQGRAADDVAEIRRAGMRARELTGQLLAFARRQVVVPQSVDVGRQLADLHRFLARLLGEDVVIDIDAPPATSYVYIDPTQLEQVILNLAANARDAMPDGGRLGIRTGLDVLDEATASAKDLAPGRYVTIETVDTGSGMAPEVAARIFEPFFTTKELGQGVGLGLATVYGIVRQAGGAISVTSVPQQGTAFRILLPETAAPVAAEADLQESTQPSGGCERVLYVEDEDVVRLLGARILRKAGYDLLVAANADEAEALLADPEARIDILVTDIVMPGRSGTELADALAQRWPDLPVLFVSGYTEERLADRRRGCEAYLPKPFIARNFLASVRALLDQPR
jgi:PAS domain S-box-containing protein